MKKLKISLTIIFSLVFVLSVAGYLIKPGPLASDYSEFLGPDFGNGFDWSPRYLTWTKSRETARVTHPFSRMTVHLSMRMGTREKVIATIPPAIPHQCLVCFSVMNPRFAGHGATLLLLLTDSSVLR